jgi:hypothetical protein
MTKLNFFDAVLNRLARTTSSEGRCRSRNETAKRSAVRDRGDT